jgi:tetratricopeptide (TPR) repeat protein
VIDWRGSLRRLLLACIALALAAPFLRPAISSALVTRGDSLLYTRDARAKEKYELALAIDPTNVDAADRYAFAAFMSRDSSDLDDGIRIATAVLTLYPRNAILRMDRALCLQLRKRYAQARADFERVGEERGDVQALALAAADAKRLGDPEASHHLLLLAHRIDPTYAPVAIALARSRS